MTSRPICRIWIPKISENSDLKLLVTIFFLVVAPATGYAAQFAVTGRVFHVRERDSVPVVGSMAMLHKVTLSGGGPVDSADTDRNGTYRFGIAEFDTTAMYVVSVEHDGIGYFTSPVRSSDGSSGTVDPLFVYDTSSTAPDLFLSQRHVIVRPRSEEGTFQVLEILLIENRGRLTRSSPDSVRPVWQGALPPGVVQFQVGESDVSDRAVSRRGDTVVVTAPVPPGDRQIVISYLIPEGMMNFDIPIDNEVERFNLLVGDSSALVTSNLTYMGIELLEDISFARYEGFGVSAGSRVLVQFDEAPIGPEDLMLPVVGLTGLALVGWLIWWMRGRGAQVNAVSIESPEVIAARIAEIEAALEADKSLSAEHSAGLRQTRDELRSRLKSALADRGKPA